MKISRDWLQTFFEQPLPDAAALADALTFHAFEIESVDPSTTLGAGNEVLDVKVTANRGHDCLSHRGIAKELSAILNISLTHDPLGMRLNLIPEAENLDISIENPDLCKRYIAGMIHGVTVGPSPEWLRKNLEAIGQRSINNVVDATNFVMFNIGQPLHAFDASKLKEKNSRYAITVRAARAGEKMLALDDKEYELSSAMMVISDEYSGAAIGIAGVKGGKPAGVDETTTDVIIESANFDGVSVRKTAAALKLRTDASARFEQVISPELAAYGMCAAAELIIKVAGGEMVGFVDEYPFRTRHVLNRIEVSIEKINAALGTKLSESDVSDVFTRIGLPYDHQGDTLMVGVPFERLDLLIPEDLIEEVGRIIGYDKIPAVELPPFHKKPDVNPSFYAAEKVREDLISKGYSEVFTSVFVDKGERAVLNKVGGDKPYLRPDLDIGLGNAVVKNAHNKDILGLKNVKLFEIGTVWKDNGEIIVVNSYTVTATTGTSKEGVISSERSGDKPISDYISNTPDYYDNLPTSTTERYLPFSKYPFIVRDIALWVPAGTEPDEVLNILRKNAGELLVHSELFDTFEKGDKVSYAFRLIFQSFDRTLIDDDANTRMESINTALKEKGYEIR